MKQQENNLEKENFLLWSEFLENYILQISFSWQRRVKPDAKTN